MPVSEIDLEEFLKDMSLSDMLLIFSKILLKRAVGEDETLAKYICNVMLSGAAFKLKKYDDHIVSPMRRKIHKNLV